MNMPKPLTRAEEVQKANTWFLENLPEAVACLKEMMKAKGKLDAMIKRLETEARAKMKQSEKPSETKKP